VLLRYAYVLLHVNLARGWKRLSMASFKQKTHMFCNASLSLLIKGNLVNVNRLDQTIGP
jgi:hypothetical protein